MTLTNVHAARHLGRRHRSRQQRHHPTCGDDASSSRNVVIDGATLERNGRQGLAVVDAEQVTLRNSTIGPVAWWGVDLETDDDCAIARHVTIDHNSFGANRYGVLGSVGFGGSPQVGDVSLTDNVQTAPTGPPGRMLGAHVGPVAGRPLPRRLHVRPQHAARRAATRSSSGAFRTSPSTRTP